MSDDGIVQDFETRLPGVVLAIANLAECSPEHLSSSRPTLPENLRSATPRRLQAFLAGRLAARRALIRAGHEHAQGDETLLGRADSGEPLWPEGFVGGVTHSGDTAAAIVGRKGGIQGLGLDLEGIVSLERARRLKNKIGRPPEWEALEPLLGEALALSLLFSAKESVYKALYPTVKRFFGFHDYMFMGWDSGKRELVLVYSGAEQPKGMTSFPERLTLHCHLEERRVWTALLWCVDDALSKEHCESQT